MRRWMRKLRRRRRHIEAHWWDIPIPAVPDPDPERWSEAIDKAITVPGGGPSGNGVLISELLPELSKVAPKLEEH